MWEDILIAILGALVVFAVLILLQYIIEAIHAFAGRNDKKQQKETAAAAPVQYNADEDAIQEVELEDEEELVAVIAAAIAASLNVSAYDLNIKSIKRVPPYTPVWNKMGRQQQLMNRL
ncbi:OadG family protein [Mahella sp.]|uniref:OadG family protein n=1 Tax=Mahella sp. TaxID=2798721 RepID=UPI0025C0D7FF|nr:OadG family protein [Mahella sp.]MBZ4665831.1 sodium pump decarboxylase, gamma subunit [Mahella sp.]MDK2903656.1 glutaconyl-CoA/methylmalonyl-CoA decarboxylase subunit delta [Clostridiales bacterium]